MPVMVGKVAPGEGGITHQVPVYPRQMLPELMVSFGQKRRGSFLGYVVLYFVFGNL